MISPRAMPVAVAGLLMLLTADLAAAGTAVFSYAVTGQANAVVDPMTGILTYAFTPDAPSATPLGPLLVSYSGMIDLTLTPPSGTTTALWDFDALGTFFGPGVETLLAADPDTLLAPFFGTSTITGGTGIFAGATGFTSYSGSFNVVTGVGSFVEFISITGPDVPGIPEPASWALLVAGFGLVGAATRRRRPRSVAGA